MAVAVILGLATLVAAYILIGYPLLLALLPLGSKPEIRKDLNFQPRVTLLLAVRNGEQYLRRKLESILALRYPRDRLEIVVVSDGSIDQTAAIAAEFAPRGVKLVDRPHQGKAAALNAGMSHATGESLFLTD